MVIGSVEWKYLLEWNLKSIRLGDLFVTALQSWIERQSTLGEII